MKSLFHDFYHGNHTPPAERFLGRRMPVPWKGRRGPAWLPFDQPWCHFFLLPQRHTVAKWDPGSWSRTSAEIGSKSSTLLPEGNDKKRTQIRCVNTFQPNLFLHNKINTKSQNQVPKVLSFTRGFHIIMRRARYGIRCFGYATGAIASYG